MPLQRGWTVISDFVETDTEVIQQLLDADSQAYACVNNVDADCTRDI